MSKRFLGALVGLVLATANVAHAQNYSAFPMPAVAETTTPAPPAIPHTPPVPDDWILYRKCENCCGPIGGDGPLRTEFYVQSGVSCPIGDGVLSGKLQTGWSIQSGARLLLFEPDLTAAWTLDLSGSNTWNQARNDGTKYPLNILLPNQFGQVQRVHLGQGNLPGVTLRDFNRTFVNLGFGRDWYMGGPAVGCCGKSCGNADWTWRIGVDGGGRYGTSSAQFEEIRHRTDVIGGIFVGLHSDLEIPCGCCVFVGGVRTEWSYTWSDILQRASDVQEINVLLSVGMRY